MENFTSAWGRRAMLRGRGSTMRDAPSMRRRPVVALTDGVLLTNGGALPHRAPLLRHQPALQGGAVQRPRVGAGNQRSQSPAGFTAQMLSEVEMEPDVDRRAMRQQTRGVGRPRRAFHQATHRRKPAPLRQMEDSGIYAAAQAEIVGAKDDPLHRVISARRSDVAASAMRGRR